MVKIGGQHLAGKQLGQQCLICWAARELRGNLIRGKGFPKDARPAIVAAGFLKHLGGFVVTPGFQMLINGICHAKFYCVFQ